MVSKLDATARFEVLSKAHARTRKHAWYRTPEYRLPEVIGGRKRARERAFRVAVARGELNTRGHRPCSEAYPCMLHQMAPSPLLTGILSCGRAAKVEAAR